MNFRCKLDVMLRIISVCGPEREGGREGEVVRGQKSYLIVDVTGLHTLVLID
jgi:hypothetical protein